MTEARMQETVEHAPGSFCWLELGTSDAEAAKNFYTELFGWSAFEVPDPSAGGYTLFQIDGKDVAGLYQLRDEQKAQGIPPHWLTYIATENANETSAKGKSLGGNVLMEPFDVMDLGRMSVLTDPTGATFAVWQAGAHGGCNVINQPNTFCWGELATTDTNRAGEFYTKLFGWKRKAGDLEGFEYTEFINADVPIGGMMTLPAEAGNIPPHWNPYIAVADCDATAGKVESLGGKILVPPSDIPHVGRFAVVQDPQGATFSIIHLKHVV